jgi:hypothetical protein
MVQMNLWNFTTGRQIYTSDLRLLVTSGPHFQIKPPAEAMMIAAF